MDAPARILVVDDEPRNLRLLEVRLSAAGYRVDSARNGYDALEQIRTDPPDLVLLDVMMPGLDGFAVMERLRADSATRSLPVILLTSLQGAEHRARGLKAGANEFLSKPIEPWALLARVRTLLIPAVSEALIAEPTELSSAGRILLFEAKPSNLEGLLGTAGYEVKRASSVAALPTLATAFMPELIVLDGSQLSALETCQRLKTEAVTRDMPLLLLTGELDPGKRASFWEARVDDYLLAPAEASELLARTRALVRRKRAADLAVRAHSEISQLALHDSLTGLANRAHFSEALRRELARAQRQSQPLSLIMLDVDNFKYYNDTQGHPAGDVVLQELAELLRSLSRSSDVPARWGGEEFALILSGTSSEIAGAIAERIRSAIEAHPFPHAKEQPLGAITVSVGIASLESQEEAKELVERADRALYASKLAGRNRVTPAPLDAVTPLPDREKPSILDAWQELTLSAADVKALEDELRHLLARYQNREGSGRYRLTLQRVQDGDNSP